MAEFLCKRKKRRNRSLGAAKLYYIWIWSIMHLHEATKLFYTFPRHLLLFPVGGVTIWFQPYVVEKITCKPRLWYNLRTIHTFLEGNCLRICLFFGRTFEVSCMIMIEVERTYKLSLWLKSCSKTWHRWPNDPEQAWKSLLQASTRCFSIEGCKWGFEKPSGLLFLWCRKKFVGDAGPGFIQGL